MKELFDKADLRLMTVEECAGHTIDYAAGWKACIDWIKSTPAANVVPVPDNVAEMKENNMNDFISRKAAMDACLDGWNKGYKEILADIKALPSAELEPIRCRDCKYAINAGTEDMMCENVNGWVVATENDFGCILAERRNNG